MHLSSVTEIQKWLHVTTMRGWLEEASSTGFSLSAAEA